MFVYKHSETIEFVKGHSSKRGSAPTSFKAPTPLDQPAPPPFPHTHMHIFKIFVSRALFSIPPPFKLFQTVSSTISKATPSCPNLINQPSLHIHTWQGFPIGVNLWGTICVKWPKTAWKLENWHFGGKKVGEGMWVGHSNFSGIVGCGDLAKLVFRIPFMTVKTKRQIAS